MALPGPLVLGKGPTPQFPPGRQLPAGEDLNQVAAQWGSVDSGVTAGAGGTRAAAYPIKAAMTQVSVVVTANDAVVLPVAYAGCVCCIMNNDAADALVVFANGSDSFRNNITTVTGATGVSLAAQASVMFVCLVAGIWSRFVSA